MANLPSSGTTGSIDNFGVTRDQFRQGMSALLDYIAESLGGVTAGGYGTQTVASSALILSSGATLAANPADNSVDTKLVTAQWVKENSIHVGPNAPSPAVEGHIWLDTSEGLKYNSGTSSSPTWSQVSITALDGITLGGDTQVVDRLRFQGPGQFVLPAGTTAQFNTFFDTVTVAPGSLRYNSQTATLEYYTTQWNTVSAASTVTTVDRYQINRGAVGLENLDNRLTYRTSSALKFSNNFNFGFNNTSITTYYAYENNVTWFTFDSTSLTRYRRGYGFTQGTGRTHGKPNWLTVTGQMYRWGANNIGSQYDAPAAGSQGIGYANGSIDMYASEAKPCMIRANASTRREQYASVLGGGKLNLRSTTLNERTTNNWAAQWNEQVRIYDLSMPISYGEGGAANAEEVDRGLLGKSVVSRIDSSNYDHYPNNAYKNYHPLTSPHPRIFRHYVGENVSYCLDDAGRVYFAGMLSQGNAGDGKIATQGALDNYPYFRQVFFYDTNPTANSNGDLYPLPEAPYISHIASSQLSEGDSGATTSWNYRYTSNYALDVEGFVYSWGYNGYGQLGNATTTDNGYAKRINPAYFNNRKIRFITCSGGMYTSVFAIDDQYNVWAWGNNTVGQLGLPNTTTYYTTPQNITLITNPNGGQSPPSDHFSAHKIIHIMCAGYHLNTHAITYFLTTEGRVFACGRATNHGAYMAVHHDTAGGDMNITVPTRLRTREGYVDESSPGTLQDVTWDGAGNGNIGSSSDRGVGALFHSGGANGTTYAVVYYLHTNSSTTTWTHNAVRSGTTKVFSWGNNAFGQLGRSTNHTAPTTVAEVAGSGPGATNSRVDNWLKPLEVRFKDFGVPEIFPNYSNTGPLTCDDSFASRKDSTSGNLTWYSPNTTNPNSPNNFANPAVTDTYKHPDEDQTTGRNYKDSLPDPDWPMPPSGLADVDSVTPEPMQVPAPYSTDPGTAQGQGSNHGNIVFGECHAIYGNGMGLETDQSVVMLMNNGQLFWVGINGINSTTGVLDPWCDGGFASGNNNDSDRMHLLTGEGEAGEINYSVYFTPIKAQPEPARDFQWYSTNGAYPNYSTKHLKSTNYGHRFSMVGYSGTVYVTSLKDVVHTSVTDKGLSLYEPIPITQSAFNAVNYNEYLF